MYRGKSFTGSNNLHGKSRIVGALLLLSVVSLLIWYTTTPSLLLIGNMVDDGYYYLKIAQNLAQTGLFTFDGLHETNGFHPLWLLLLALGYRVAMPTQTVGLAMAAGVQAVLLVLSLLLMYRCARHIGPATSAWFAVAIFGWPRIIAFTLKGMETGLYVFLLLLFVGHSLRYGTFSGRKIGATSAVASGILLGLMFLARLDSVFIIMMAVGYYSLVCVRSSHSLREAVFRSALLIAPLATLVMSYFAWNMAKFHHLMTTSGSLKRAFPYPGFNMEAIKRFPEAAVLFIVICVIVIVALRVIAQSCQAGRAHLDSLAPVLLIIGGGCLLHFLDSVLFMRWGVYPWHFTVYGVPAALGMSWLLSKLPEWAPRSMSVRPHLSSIALSVALLLIIGAWGFAVERYKAKMAGWKTQGYTAAQWANRHIPANNRFGMRDAGAFGYFCAAPTVNLDGLVNDFDFARFLREGRIGEYIKQTGIGYLVYHAAQPSDLQHGCKRLLYSLGLGNARGKAVYTRSYYEPGKGQRFYVIVEVLSYGVPTRDMLGLSLYSR